MDWYLCSKQSRVLFVVGGAELVDSPLPQFVLQTYFLGALAHGGEVLVVRRIGRPRDGDGVNPNGYVCCCIAIWCSYFLFFCRSAEMSCKLL